MPSKRLLTSKRNEKGMVLVVAILIMAVLLLLGSTAIMTTATDMKISTNYKAGLQAFYIADAGLERARNLLRSSCSTAAAISSMLDARTGDDGILSDSTDIANFYNNGSFVTDDLPLIADTTFGSGTYRVYITNDPAEGPAKTTDGNFTVTLTSFGQGPNKAFSAVQSIVRLIVIPPTPGAIVLPGPNVNFLGADSNDGIVDGGSESAISFNSIRSQMTVKAMLSHRGPHGMNHYTCDAGRGASCINNEAPADFSTDYRTVSGIHDLVNRLKTSADVIYSGPRTLTADDVGTMSDRKIVVVEGDALLENKNGAGILVVTGRLTLTGDFNYNGLILVAGEGHLVRKGGGSGTLTGSVVVANTDDALSDTVLGVSTFDMSGGGDLNITYDDSQMNPPGMSPFVKIAWRQM